MAQTQVRLPDALMERISSAAERTGMSKNDIFKLTVEAGLKWLAANDYDLAQHADPRPLILELRQTLDEWIRSLSREKTDAAAVPDHITKLGPAAVTRYRFDQLAREEQAKHKAARVADTDAPAADRLTSDSPEYKIKKPAPRRKQS